LVKWKDYGNEENTWEPRRHLDHATELIQEFYHKYPTAVRRIVQVLETTGKSFTIGMRELQGVIETKTNLRKGYCQDQLPIGSTIAKKGRSNDWKEQGFHRNDGKDNLFPSRGEVQGFHRSDEKDNLFPSRGEVQGFHRSDEKDNLFPLRGEVQGFHRNDGRTTCFHQEEKSRNSR